MDLKEELTLTLYSIYDSDIFAPIMEFLQGETRVLLFLIMNKNKEVYPSDLSESLNVTRQRITSILSSLRKKEFVVMELSKKDRRRMQVFLTYKGKKHIVAKIKIAEHLIDTLIDRLGYDNVKELSTILQMVVRNK